MRKYFKKKITKTDNIETSKLDLFLEKYNLPKAFFATNRRMITRGIFIGLFWAFIPMPMQMLAVVAMTPFVRFNIPVAIAMVWLSNPLTMPPMYYMEYLTGNFILGLEGVKDIELTLTWFSENIDDILIPLYVGTAFYSIVVSAIIYFIVNWLWIHSVKKERKERYKTTEKKNR